MKIKSKPVAAYEKGKMTKQKAGGNRKSILAFLIGILIASCGILFPGIFFSNEDEVLVGRQYTVNVLSSDSVHTITRDISFTLADYAYITEMTRFGSRYYSEPTDAQLSMREASNAAGEILKALLPNVFTGDVKQPYTLSSAILTSNVQSSEEDYDYRQSFWYVDISYPDDIDDITVSSTINAVNGKAWTVVATFPVSSAAYDSYGIRVAEDIQETWGIASNLFYTDAPMAAGINQAALFPAHSEETEVVGEEDEYYAEYLADEGVLVYNASCYFEHLENAVQTMDGLTDFMTQLFKNYMEYLGIEEEIAEQVFSLEVCFDDDFWYSLILDDCRELVSLMDSQQQDSAVTENFAFSEIYSKSAVDTILLNSDLYDESLILMDLLEHSSALDVFLTATDESSGLSVTTGLQIYCDEVFTISISLGFLE